MTTTNTKATEKPKSRQTRNREIFSKISSAPPARPKSKAERKQSRNACSSGHRPQ